MKLHENIDPSFFTGTRTQSSYVYWRQLLELQIICNPTHKLCRSMNRKTDTTNSMERHAIHSSRGCSSTFTGSNRLHRSVISVIPYQLEWYRPLCAKPFSEPDIATNSGRDCRIISYLPRELGEAKIKLPPRCPSCVKNLTKTRRTSTALRRSTHESPVLTKTP